MLPCLLFEDEHLLVVNKPAGINTHAPGPYAGEGIYDWLRHREPRWSNLAIIHRLDKETSGVILFSKTALANKALTQQFTQRSVRKKYVFLTDQPPPRKEFVVENVLVRLGDKYSSRRGAAAGQPAVTRFQLLKAPPGDSVPGVSNTHWIEAEPLTGRTHQIRSHAAENGFPILGDQLYGGTPAPRVFLHASELAIRHPVSNQIVTFKCPPAFQADPRAVLRSALIDQSETDAYRVYHGASDGWPGWYVDRVGHHLLSQSDHALKQTELDELARLVQIAGAAGASHKHVTRSSTQKSLTESSPRPLVGQPAPDRSLIRENGLRFELSFAEGCSIGLFFDQRDNRRRLLAHHIAADFPVFARNAANVRALNTFAYTCGFSVCAAKAGAHTTNLDLSKKYLDWGRRNFELNGLDTKAHEFIYGDVFGWLPRLARKQRCYDLILLDPPTFSQSKESGVFRAEKDYGKLVHLALPLLERGGVLFASTNAADWPAEKFAHVIDSAIRSARRTILQSHYFPQPPDFPISRAEPAYLKTVWLRIA